MTDEERIELIRGLMDRSIDIDLDEMEEPVDNFIFYKDNSKEFMHLEVDLGKVK